MKGRPTERPFSWPQEVRMLEKPPAVAADRFKSAKWDEITAEQRLTRSDVPALALLCQWRKIAQLAQDELHGFGEHR